MNNLSTDGGLLGDDDDFLREVTSHADRLPHAAYCLGCHGGQLIHIMISREYDDPTLIHVSARHNPRDLDALDRLQRILRSKGMDFVVFNTSITGPTRHLRFKVPG